MVKRGIITYKYAFKDDGTKNVVSISDITEESRKQCKYFCIGCGKELLPRAINSKCRQPHFYHKEMVECSGETYLHKLTKHVIKQKFDNSPEFIVGYYVTKTCNHTQCKYRNNRCKKDDYFYEVNLKEHYDTCTLEAPVKSFVADILLTNSKRPEQDPVLIEVCVKHPCDEEKRNSGLRIIELKIQTEQDVMNLQNKPICESTEYIKNVEFISFKRELSINNSIYLQRYVYIPNQNHLGYISVINCRKAQFKLKSNSAIELNLIIKGSDFDFKLIDALWWLNYHKGWRSCYSCTFHYIIPCENKISCGLSKKYGTPVHPNKDEAVKCKYYSQKKSSLSLYHPKDIFVEEVILKPEYKVILAVSPSFNDYDLFKQKFLYYLSEKRASYTLVVLTGASKHTDEFITKLSEEFDFIKEPHNADWDKYSREEAIRISNDEMTSSADAIIAFWDGNSRGIKQMIELAKQKNKKVAVVEFNPKKQKGSYPLFSES